MKTKSQRFFTLSALVTSLMLSACGTTDTQLALPVSNIDRINFECESSVDDMRKVVSLNGEASQQITLAKTALHCIDGIHFFPKHPDNQKAMQLMALATINFLKGGDISAADNTLNHFRNTFPKQDLFFADYTSFIDTASALLKQNSMPDHQLAALNINAKLRNEIKRQRYWLAN